jgi:hypothetical protein
MSNIDVSSLYPHEISLCIVTWSSNINTKKLQWVVSKELSYYMPISDEEEIEKMNDIFEKLWKVQNAKDKIEEEFKDV